MPRHPRLSALLLSLAAATAALAACSSDGTDAPMDAQPDAPPIDAGPDAAPIDGAPDAAPQACGSDFDCGDPAAPTCGERSTCVAPPSGCTGDDVQEPDDGPSIATELTGFVNGSLCSLPGESDYYRFTVGSERRVLRIGAGNGLVVAITDAEGQPAAVEDFLPNDILVEQPGVYYAQLFRESTPSAEATPYSLSFEAPECLTDLECPTSEPVCAAYRCEPGPAACTEDDSYEPDDGATVATPLGSLPIQIAAKLCWVGSGNEVDWFQVDLDGAPITITLDWSDTQHIGFVLFDAALNPIAADLQFHPATATVESASGPHYVAIVRMANSGTGLTPYSLRLTH